MEFNTPRHIRFPQVKFKSTGITKTDAVEKLTEYVNQNLNSFYDNEMVAIEYFDGNNLPCTSTAIIVKGLDEHNNPAAIIKIQLNSDETIPIVETESSAETPDTSVIWLTDDGTSPDMEKVLLKEQVGSLSKKNKELEERIQRLEYILTGEYDKDSGYTGGGVIAGGDILNSVKYELENRYETEKPADARSSNYAKDDFTVTHFDVYLGDAPLTDYESSGATLFCNVDYYLKVKLFNQADEEVENKDEDGNQRYTITYSITANQESADIDKITKGILHANIQGSITVSVNVETIQKIPFTIKFSKNEKPEYATYIEPNVKHVLIKTVETEELLRANQNYLCAPEMVWCIGTNSLYIRAKAANGNIALFKLFGNGATPSEPTGSTETTTFTLEDSGILNIQTTDTDNIYIDGNGYLVLNGYNVDDNGVLILTDKK